MSFTNHIENYLGKIEKAWTGPQGFQVIPFQVMPEEGITTFLTLGLSHHELELSSSKKVRHEFLFAANSSFSSQLIVNCLLSLCESVVEKHKAVLRGEVIHFPVEMLKDAPFNIVYCTIPTIFDDGFTTYYGSDPPIVIVWVVPIQHSEAHFITEKDWDAFEDIIVEKDPDLFNPNRPPII